jgi:hypothetical protein
MKPRAVPNYHIQLPLTDQTPISGASVPERYAIEPINHATAMAMVVRHHYMHRPAPCSFAFGMIDRTDGRLAGCIVYGTPSSAPLRSGICGPEHACEVIELTRLWIEDGTPKNVESYLIGNTLRMVDKPIIVSFAEIEAGHVGTVYQATNWIYTGLSAKRTDWTVEGIDRHGQTIADRYTAEELRRKYGDRFSIQPRPRKHRYIFFNCGRLRRKELLRKLRYAQQPYPKSYQAVSAPPQMRLI